MGKLKIPALRITSDDCAITLGRVLEGDKVVREGTKYYTHQGEWVEIVPVQTIAESLAINRMQQALADRDDITPENVQAMITQHLGGLEGIARELSQRIVSWSWTGLDGEPYQQPHRNPAALLALSTDELYYLMRVAQSGENAETRKNA